MKKRLFTLLLAAAGLSIFQANAEKKLEGWIRVDRSGLAKHEKVSQNDSFPNKKWGFDSWLSMKGDKGDTVYVRSQQSPDSSSSEIATDEHSRFIVESVGSTNRFKISSKSGVSLKAKWDIPADVDVSTFEIVRFDAAGKKIDDQSTANDSIEGYMVLFPYTSQEQTDCNAVFAGVDGSGNISFKAFSDFAFYSDSVPASPWLSYQFTKDTVQGRLYQSGQSRFQTYYNDSALVNEGDKPVDWNKGKSKLQNPVIFTYYDFKYIGEDVLLFNKNKNFYLNTLVSQTVNDNEKSVVDTTSFKKDSLLYFRVDDKNDITFTALTAGEEWTNGEPSKFPHSEQPDSVFYYIDATGTTAFGLDLALRQILNTDSSLLIPSKRYIYKNDDNWRPLYINLAPATLAKSYKYVTEDWLTENDFDLTAATQHVFEFPYLAISDSATVSRENAVRLSFEPVAGIDADSTISGLTDKKFAGGGIDLFHIKNDNNKYLTVSKEQPYSSSGSEPTVANTKLKWDNRISEADSLRQAFAIIRDTVDSVFTFLPVASYKYLGTAYNTDSLYYNLNIGKISKDDQGKDVSFDIDSIWHITVRSLEKQLVITDKQDDENENIWLKLAVDLKHHWEGPVVYEDSTFTVVYGKGKTHHYSAGGKYANEAGALLTDSIRSHWRVNYIDEDNDKPRVAFTPRIDTIYGDAQNTALTDTVFALDLEDGKIVLVPYNNKSKRDTVEIDSIKSTYALPFKNLDHLDSLKVAILAGGSESYNLSNDNGNAVLRPISATSDTFRVVLHKSSVETLADGLLHIPYYLFSTPDSLFLKADIVTDSVQWVKVAGDEIALLLDETNREAEYAPYRFSLPYKGTEGENVYLQTFSHSTQIEDYGLIVNSSSILFSVNAHSFERILKHPNKYVGYEGIYSALDQYKDNVQAAFWEIRHTGPGQATGLKKVVPSSAKIYGVAGGVRVIGASGAVTVYTVDGRPVSTGAVVSSDQTIAVPAGIYIVKNGVHAVKVVVK
ncbi:MAG: T9SS type A sorting domain-containing protein [Dysgonamonadaceae bacterium]|jgi:hypothetical protein|nr:T9SS type A sorting domain-containing protein [Dysgonamonadaceae bacterium]